MRPLLFASLFGLVLLPLSAVAQPLAPSVASLTRSQTVNEGRSLTLSVSADGSLPFTFQWRKDGVDLSGATTTSYTIDPVRVAHAGSYTVIISNAVGTITSDPILIAVNPATAPTFYHQPQNASFTIGGTLSLRAYASGTDPLTYQWYKDGAVIPGATNPYFQKSDTTAADAGTYKVEVSNIAGAATSADISVTASAPTAPTFTTQPASFTADIGEHRSLHYSVSGTGPLTHELYKGTELISVSSWGSFSFYPVTATHAGTYTIKVTNSVGSATSQSFTIALNPPKPPIISLSSNATNLRVGQSLHLNPYLQQGTAPVTYQWYKDDVAIPGATEYHYSKSNLQLSDAGNYKVTATNSVGSSTSSAVNVSVTSLTAPIITSHPASGAFHADHWVSLYVGATGDNLSYQWRKDGVIIPGATSSQLNFGYQFSASHVGSYTVTVSNSQGSVTSEAAEVKLLPSFAPVITRHPASLHLEPGNSGGFEVSAAGRPSVTYQWRKNGVNIADAKYSSIYFSQVAASDSGTYTVVVTNSLGSVTSATATLTVSPLTAPVITRHPSSASLLPGSYHSLSIEVSSHYGSAYQWMRNGVAIPGATYASYSIDSAQPSHAGTYTVKVTNAAGEATSEPAIIRVDTNATIPVITFSSGSRASSAGSWIYHSIGTSVTNPTIQWRLNGVPIPSSNSGTLSFSASAAAAGTYTAVVTHGGQTYTSPEIKFVLLDSSAPPKILRHPAAVSVDPGRYAGFDIYVSGSEPFTYQWYKDGQAIPLATHRYLEISAATTADAGKYKVIVTNAHGSETSDEVELSIRSARAPVIVNHPASRAVSTSDYSFNFSVNVDGSEPISYQWYKDDVAISGATSSYLSRPINNSAPGVYHVVVTNPAGSATSTKATVTLVQRSTGPTFTAHPQSQTITGGSNVTFNATVTGRGTLTYQWRKNGANIPGATNASLTLSNVTSGDAAVYTLLVTDADGAASSQPATLTIQPGTAPAITSHPKDVYAVGGDTVSFTVTATGDPAPSFQWRRNGNNITGATGATYSISGLTAAHAGTYTVVVTNAWGSVTSQSATLTVLTQPAAAPVFLTHPQSQTVAPGRTATFTVQVDGSPTPTLQWRKNGHAIAGANAATLTLQNVQDNDAGEYSVVASNAFGTATSQAALLTIGATPSAIYFGTIGSGGESGSWALLVMSDGTGRFFAFLPGRQQAIIVDITVGSGGTITFGGQTGLASAPNSTSSRYYHGPGELKLHDNGTATGKLSALNLNLSGNVATGASSAAFVGLFEAVPLYTAAGTAALVVAPDGRCFALVVDADGVMGGLGSVTGNQFSVQASAQSTITGTLDVTERTLAGAITTTGANEVKLAPAKPATPAERLANVSTRALAGKGSETLIAGFVITGNSPRSVLIRAAGPALEAYKVAGFLADPVLLLYQGDKTIYQNDDWEKTPIPQMIIDATQQAGAFPFPSGSKDAAMVMGLMPGLYTTHVTTKDGAAPGVALVEVYDLGESGAGQPRLVNLSARGQVGKKDDILIVGLVVTGSNPKRYLIRAVGPTLETDFKLSGALQNPLLRLHKGNTLVRQNDDWSAGGDAGDIAAAAAKVGAFALPLGSQDSAVLVYLEPGLYTAHVSGVNDTTGVALVEAYEVP
jgi:large repetitive protein